MATQKDFKTNVKNAANTAIKKTGEIADMASMHIKLKSLEHKLGDAFKELGKLTYKQLKTGASQAEKIAEAIDGIDKIKEDIRLMKEKIESEKQARAERKKAAAEGISEE